MLGLSFCRSFDGFWLDVVLVGEECEILFKLLAQQLIQIKVLRISRHLCIAGKQAQSEI